MVACSSIQCRGVALGTGNCAACVKEYWTPSATGKRGHKASFTTGVPRNVLALHKGAAQNVSKVLGADVAKVLGADVAKKKSKPNLNTVSIASPTKTDVRGHKRDAAPLSPSPDRSASSKRQKPAGAVDSVLPPPPPPLPQPTVSQGFPTSPLHVNAAFNFGDSPEIPLITSPSAHSQQGTMRRQLRLWLH